MLGILEFLTPRGFDVTARTKLVRHQDKRYDICELERKGLFELYQSYQRKPVFECDYLISFIGLENSLARLQGIYRVQARLMAKQRPLPAGFVYPDFAVAEGFFYELCAVPGFEDLIGRLVIAWGGSPLAWHQWLTNKEVIEVLPIGYVREFPGYLDFVLTYAELIAIVNNPQANREWHRMLAAVAGVYLIVDTNTGKQYVGSASGEMGILGRWKAYADLGHGNNKQLSELVISDLEYARHFQFTILRTLPRTLTRAEVIAYEILYKKKLGSRAFGLNSN